MSRLTLCGALFAVCTLTHPALAADAFSLKPGQWDFEMTTKVASMPKESTQRSSSCIEAETDPIKAMTSGSQCSVSNREESASTLRWEIECATGMGGPPMKGKGEITSDGSSAQGKMQLTMSVQGRQMTMNSTWSGKRTGPCKP